MEEIPQGYFVFYYRIQRQTTIVKKKKAKTNKTCSSITKFSEDIPVVKKIKSKYTYGRKHFFKIRKTLKTLKPTTNKHCD